MGRIDVDKPAKGTEKAKKQKGGGEASRGATIAKIAFVVIALGATAYLLIPNFTNKPNEFVVAPPPEAEQAQPAAPGEQKPAQMQVKARESADRPKSIGNAGGAKYLPDVAPN